MLEENGHISEGTILYNGQDLAQIKSNDEWAKIRGGEIATIFQDPMTSLNPILTIGKQIVEVIEKHQKIKGEKAKQIAIDLMKKKWGFLKPKNVFRIIHSNILEECVSGLLLQSHWHASRKF